MTGFDPGRPRLRGLLSADKRARLGKAGQKAAGIDAGEERRKAREFLSAVNRARKANGLLSGVNRARKENRVADRLRRLGRDRLLRLLDAKARGEIPETDFVGLREVYLHILRQPHMRPRSRDEWRKAKRKEAVARVLKARDAMDRGEIPETDFARLREVYMKPRGKRGRRRKASTE